MKACRERGSPDRDVEAPTPNAHASVLAALACLLALAGCADLEARFGPFPQAPRILEAKAAVYIDSDLALYYDRDRGTCVLPVDHREALDRLGYPLARMNVFRKTEVVASPACEDADFIVTLSLPSHTVTYRGHNQWFPVAIGVWFLVWVPAWWVPDETFDAEMDVEIAVKDCLTGKEVYRTSVHASTTRHLNDLERGWTPLAVFNDAFDEENFRQAARRLDRDLWKTVHEKMFHALSEELPEALEQARWKPRFTDRAVVVGIGDDAALADADAVASFLVETAGFDPADVLLVKGRRGEPVPVRPGELAVDPFEKVFETIRQWKRIPFPERNRILFYFAGEGAVLQDGMPALVSSSGEEGRLPLARLLAPLDGLIASTVVLDAGFRAGGGIRSFPASGSPDGKALERLLSETPASVVLAVPPGQEGFVDPVSGGGVFTSVLLRAMKGAADADGDGEISRDEASRYLVSQTSGFASALGRDTTPFLRLGEEVWFPMKKKRTGAEPGDEDADSPDEDEDS